MNALRRFFESYKVAEELHKSGCRSKTSFLVLYAISNSIIRVAWTGKPSQKLCVVLHAARCILPPINSVPPKGRISSGAGRSPKDGTATGTGSCTRMGDISSGSNAWLRRSQMLTGPAKCAFRVFWSLTLVAAVFLAVTIPPAPSADYIAEVELEHSSNDIHAQAPCDEGFVCSAYIFSELLGGSFSDLEYQILLITLEMPLRKFSTPQVDLPPPRAAA